ncbi:MAG: 7-carboxy-7-deazaguanine synthase [Smithellaceae bacterium]
MSYSVKEIFYSLQGEGFHAGRPAVFCRFTGCNLWSGKEEDRSTAVCRFCDTDFVHTDGPRGGKYATAEELVRQVAGLWPSAEKGTTKPFVVCTGGEPLLQLDAELAAAFHRESFFIAVETNGTILPPDGIDWLCVSPKAGAELLVRAGQELKLVFPQAGIEPQQFACLDFQHFFLQPLDGPDLAQNTKLAVEYVLAHPQWRLSLQMHKILNIK